MQRSALQFVIDNSFNDDAFGVTPELLRHTTVDKWFDAYGFRDALADATLPIHDQVMGVQASAMTMMLNPQTLQRVFDLELYTPADQDMLTLAEVMTSVKDAAWSEIASAPTRKYTERSPMVSSFRRNLQREHLERLIDLSMGTGGMNAAQVPVKTLAVAHLRELHGKIEERIEDSAKLDAYTSAHLGESKIRIEKALDAAYIYNADDIGGGMSFSFPFMNEGRSGRD
jgi:hypothetical protein